MGYAVLRNIIIIFSYFLPDDPVVAKTLIPVNLMFLEHLKVSFGTSYIAGTLSFILERLFATIFLSNYETKRWPIFIVFCYIFQISAGFGVTTLVFSRKYCPKNRTQRHKILFQKTWHASMLRPKLREHKTMWLSEN